MHITTGQYLSVKTLVEWS